MTERSALANAQGAVGRCLLWLLGIVACLAFLWGPQALVTCVHERPDVRAAELQSSVLYLGWGLAVSVVLFLSLAVTYGRWAPLLFVRPSAMTPSLVPVPSRSGKASRTGIIMLGLLLLALALRLPMMERSISNDEQKNLALNIHGYWSCQAVDQMPIGDEALPAQVSAWVHENGVWQAAEWSDCWYMNAGQNNSPLYSLAARCCLQLVDFIRLRAVGTCDLAAIRVPALVAGVISILLLFSLVQRLDGSLSGVVAALMLAVHPLHLEFSTRARGYSFLILWVIFSLYFLERASVRGRYFWIGFHFAVALIGCTFPGAIYAMVMLECCALGVVLMSGRRESPESLAMATTGTAWIASGMLVGALLAPLLVPVVMNAAAFAHNDYPYRRFPDHHLERLWNTYLLGLNQPPAPANATLVPAWDAQIDASRRFRPPLVTKRSMAADSWRESRLRWLGFVGGALLLGVGVHRCWRRNRIVLGGLMALCLSAVLAVLHQRYGLGCFGLYWYYLYALPAVCTLVALGLPEIGQRGRMPLRAGLGFLVVVLFAWLSWPSGTRGRFDYCRALGQSLATMREWSPHDRWVTFSAGYTVHLPEAPPTLHRVSPSTRATLRAKP